VSFILDSVELVKSFSSLIYNLSLIYYIFEGNNIQLNMKKKYHIQKSPFIVPTTDGKLIEEHFGNATIKSELSIAHMIAPPKWSEPFQTPAFDEYTYIIKGKKQFNIEGEIVTLESGQSIKIEKGARVQYSNPFNEACEYLAICLPAFSMGLVNREA
jgi:mannose-6-phosphate isomerase-like protein (cupin superfamily)